MTDFVPGPNDTNLDIGLPGRPAAAPADYFQPGPNDTDLDLPTDIPPPARRPLTQPTPDVFKAGPAQPIPFDRQNISAVKAVGNRTYLQHNNGVIYDATTKLPTSDPAVLEAFGQSEPNARTLALLRARAPAVHWPGGIETRKPGVQQATKVDLPSAQADASGFTTELRHGFYKGAVEGNIKNAGAALQSFGDLTGNEAVYQLGTDARAAADKTQAIDPRVASFKDVHSLQDFLDYAAGATGSAAGSSLPSIAMGMGGTALGRRIGGGPGAVAGGLAGTLGASEILNVGDMRVALEDEGIKDRKTLAKVSIVAGQPLALLDTAFPEWMVGKVFTAPAREAIKRTIAKRVAVEAAKGVAIEANTEWVQNVTEYVTAKVTAGKPVNPDEIGNIIADSIIATAGVGGVGGAAAGAAEGKGAIKAQPGRVEPTLGPVVTGGTDAQGRPLPPGAAPAANAPQPQPSPEPGAPMGPPGGEPPPGGPLQPAPQRPAPGSAPFAPGFQPGPNDTDVEGLGTRASPINVRSEADMQIARGEIAEPTPPQAEAENHKAGHIRIEGLPGITLENAKGSMRRRFNPDGSLAWESEMPVDYGRFKGVKGPDGSGVDVYIGPYHPSDRVYVIDQQDPDTEKFDEPKVMVGFMTQDEAVRAYVRSFSDGRGLERIQNIRETDKAGLKAWLAKGPRKKPFAALPKQPEPVQGEPASTPEVTQGPGAEPAGPSPPIATAAPVSGPLLSTEPPNAIENLPSQAHTEAPPAGRPVAPGADQYSEAAPRPAGGMEGAGIRPEGIREPVGPEPSGARPSGARGRGLPERPGPQERGRPGAEAVPQPVLGHAQEGPPSAAFISPSTGERPQEAPPQAGEGLREPVEMGVRGQDAGGRRGEGRDIAVAQPVLAPHEVEQKLTEELRRAPGYFTPDHLNRGRAYISQGMEPLDALERALLDAEREEENADYAGTHQQVQEAPVPQPEQAVPAPEAAAPSGLGEGLRQPGAAGGGNAGLRAPDHGAAPAEQAAAELPGAGGVQEARPEPHVSPLLQPGERRPSRTQIADRLQEIERRIDALSEALERSPGDMSILAEMGGLIQEHERLVRDFNTAPEVEQVGPEKKPATPQVPSEPGTKYVLPSFVTHGLTPEKPGEAAKGVKPEDYKDIPLADAYAEHFRAGGSFNTIVHARRFASEQGAAEAQSTKDTEEALEQGLVLTARSIVQDGLKAEESQEAIYDKLVNLYARQPKLGARTSKSVADQAYSTPLPLAYLASRLAHVNDVSSVYEPTAGNGALLLEARNDPQQGRRIAANEMNPDRARFINDRLGIPTTQNDATEREPTKAASIIMNPPFGAVKDEEGRSRLFKVDGLSTHEIDHAIALKSLQGLSERGHAVLILGGINKLAATREARSDAYNGRAKREFFYRLYNRYNVVDHFTVAGSLYEKQGAGWPVDVIVINGRGKSARALPAVDVPRVYASWDELKEKLNGQAPATPSGEHIEQAPEPPASGGGLEGAGAEPGEHVAPERPPAREPEAGQPADIQPRPDLGQPGPSEGGATPSRPQANVVEERGDTGRPGVEPPAVAAPKRPPQVEGTEHQTPYRPASQRAPGLGTLVPTNMRTSVAETLDALEKKVGSIDDFVAKRLEYPVEDLGRYFSAEQVDAIAMALDAFDKGRGFVIGDQTGIGKGRVVAAMIRYADKQGATPIFITEKPGLYADMIRDLKAIGTPLKPFMTNSGEKVPTNDDETEFLTSGSPGKQDQLMSQMMGGDGPKAAGFDVIFTTYSQMQTVQGKDTNRRRFLREMARGGFVIMDESHNAGGVKKEGWGADKKAPDRAALARELVKIAKAAFYSSATYAKRPDVMDLYARTDMGLAVKKPEELGPLIQKGGVPMQQVVASMLAKAGQYIRRERSFQGIRYDTRIVNVDRKAYDGFSRALKAIMDFSKQAVKNATEAMDEQIKAEAQAIGGDNATGGAGASSTTFSSIMHNVINQMLLSISADATAERAIELIKEGKKPVITVSNTMESFLTNYATDMGLSPGDVLDADFGTVLMRYLDRSRIILIKNPDRTSKQHVLTDEELGPIGVAQYKAAKKLIEGLTLSSLPLSPIDAIKAKIQNAGYNIAEVTGRSGRIDYRGKSPVYGHRPQGELSTLGKRRSIAQFNNGTVDAIIINRSGSTGLSLHSSVDFKDQRPRVMLIAQAEGNIDTHMQVLGRINRTGQVNLPAYEQMVADIPAMKRPAAVLMKKMASLNANTTAARKGALTAKDVPDFMNEYGDRVAFQVMLDNPDLNAALDYPVGLDDHAEAMRRVTGRIPLLPLTEQERIYDMLESEYSDLIEAMDALGTNALEAKALDLDARPIDVTEISPRTGASPFQGAVNMEISDIKAVSKPFTREQVETQLAAIKDAALEEKAQSDFAEYRRQQTDLMEEAKPDVRQAQETRLAGILTRWRDTYRYAHPGAQVTLKTAEEGNLHGFVVEVRQTGAPKNPLALGSWKAKILLPTAARQITVPFSRLFPAGHAIPEDDMGAIELAGPTMPRDELLADFDKKQKTARDTRSIITGNLLKGYEQMNGSGRIISFTDHAGRVRQGILMPEKFDFAEWLKTKGVEFDKASQVIEYMAQATIGLVTSKDGLVKIERNTRGGDYVIEVPASKSQGGQYFLHPAVRKASGDRFEKRGSVMRLYATSDEFAESVIAALMKAGARFEVTENQEIAERIKGQGKRKASAGPRGPEQGYYQKIQRPLEGFPLQPRMRAKLILGLDDIAKRLLGHGLGQGIVNVRVVDQATLDEHGAQAFYDVSYDGGARAQTITVALQAISRHGASGLLRHEIMHAYKEMGVFTAQEWKILERKAEKQWMQEFDVRERWAPYGMDESSLLEEAIAEGFMFFQKGRREGTLIDRIFEKLTRFLEAAQNFINGMGFQTAQGVLERMESGELYETRLAGVEELILRHAGAGRRYSAPELPAERGPLPSNLNLDNLNTSEDIKQALRWVAAQHREFEGERRGVVSNAATARLAEQLGMRPGDLLKRRHGQAFNAHQIYAARVLMNKSMRRLIGLAEKAEETNAWNDMAAFYKAFTQHAAIQEQVAGATAEAGRALQQFRMLAGDQFYQASRRLVEAAQAKGMEGPEAVALLARMTAAAADPVKVAKLTRAVYKPGFWDMARELYVAFLVSGPRTHAANILSNLITAFMRPLETAVAAGVGTLHGGEKVSFKEVLPELIGLVEGVREGAAAGWEAVKTEEPQSLRARFDQPHRRAIPGPAGRVARLSLTALMAEDEVFKAMNRQATINQLAVRYGLATGKTGRELAEAIADLKNNPTEAMMRKAIEAADYHTFQAPLGPIAQYIMGLREKGRILGWVIAPFIRTAVNLSKYAAERSPLPLLAYFPGEHAENVRAILKGEKGNVERDMLIARMLIGSSLMAAVITYMATGLLTGSGPDDPKKRALLYLDGWQPYSVKIGGTWYSYQRLDPWALMIGIAADMVEMGSALSKADAKRAWGQLIASVAGNLQDKTWLKGPADFFAAVTDRTGSTWERWGQNIAGNVVPNLFAQIAQYTDPNLRDARTTLDKIKTRIPGLSQTVPPRLTIFGEEIKKEGSWGPDLLSPIYTTTEKRDPVVKELIRLDYAPSMPKRQIKGHDLTPEQYQEYARMSGKAIKQQLDRQMRSWGNMADEEKIKRVKGIFEHERERARKAMIYKYPDLRQPAQ